MKRRNQTFIVLGGILLFILIFWWVIFRTPTHKKTIIRQGQVRNDTSYTEWKPPDNTQIPETEEGKLILYGKELIVHTAQYFGPKGKISLHANGLNCQNCHLYAGTKVFGNNFSLAAHNYPKYRSRRASVESLFDRINGCMTRSMNGDPLDTQSKEMKAIVAYMNWIGSGLQKDKKIYGSSNENIPWLQRAADPVKGRVIFETTCARCHGKDGQGVLNHDSTEYIFPPLWGPHSYNTGAGMYRISKFADFVRYNMPFGASYRFPLLNDEQAWDVAAFVNSQPHPVFKEIQKDWPDISQKPVDYPFGPYTDKFSEIQHKYGPFLQMKKQMVNKEK